MNSKNLSSTVLTKEIDGAQLKLEVCPCSWMYPGYGLQAKVSMENNGDGYIHDKLILFENATVNHFQAMFDKVKIQKCTRCNNHAFDPSSIETNRGGLCEKCFVDDLLKRYEEEENKEKEEKLKLNQKYKSEGFTHCVDAWIHPDGGDDCQISIWFKGVPTDAKIKSILKKNKSVVLTDYRIFTI